MLPLSGPAVVACENESAAKRDALQTLRGALGPGQIAPAFGVRGACSRFLKLLIGIETDSTWLAQGTLCFLLLPVVILLICKLT